MIKPLSCITLFLHTRYEAFHTVFSRLCSKGDYCLKGPFIYELDMQPQICQRLMYTGARTSLWRAGKPQAFRASTSLFEYWNTSLSLGSAATSCSESMEKIQTSRFHPKSSRRLLRFNPPDCLSASKRLFMCIRWDLISNSFG